MTYRIVGTYLRPDGTEVRVVRGTEPVDVADVEALDADNESVTLDSLELMEATLGAGGLRSFED